MQLAVSPALTALLTSSQTISERGKIITKHWHFNTLEV